MASEMGVARGSSLPALTAAMMEGPFFSASIREKERPNCRTVWQSDVAIRGFPERAASTARRPVEVDQTVEVGAQLDGVEIGQHRFDSFPQGLEDDEVGVWGDKQAAGSSKPGDVGQEEAVVRRDGKLGVDDQHVAAFGRDLHPRQKEDVAGRGLVSELWWRR